MKIIYSNNDQNQLIKTVHMIHGFKVLRSKKNVIV